MLRQKLQQDLVRAMKARESGKVEVIRFLMSKVKYKEIEDGKELEDEQIVGVIQKQVKELNEAAEMFTKGGRQDLADDNKVQAVILEAYLPPELSDAELEGEIKSLIVANQEMFNKSKQSLIGVAMKQLAGKARPERIMAFLRPHLA